MSEIDQWKQAVGSPDPVKGPYVNHEITTDESQLC